MFNTALKNIRRSPYQAITAIIIVCFTLFVSGLFGIITLTSQEILKSFETKPQIIAYLKDTHTIEQVNSLVSSLSSTTGVKKVFYVSKAEALELYKKSVNNDPVLLGTVTDWGIVTADILPASVEITATDPKFFPNIVSILETSDIVSTTPQNKKEIDYPQDVISELTRWTSAIRGAGLVLISILASVTVITIMTIVSMKISSRRTEISTLKLLGARNWFIVRPYIAESMIYGIVGSIFAWILCFITLLYSTPFLAPRLSGVITFPIPFETHMLLAVGLIVSGFFLSFISGVIASIRFAGRAR